MKETCPLCRGEGELLCGLYPPPECVRCKGSGAIDGTEPWGRDAYRGGGS